jgi:hypothetical protein
MDIAEFSAMATGAVSFQQLYNYGLAQISNTDFTPLINQLFLSSHKPICLSRF